MEARVPASAVLAGPRFPPPPSPPPALAVPPAGGGCPPPPGVSARGQLCPGLRLRRSRCITERKIPPDGGLGLLLFSQGAVPLARPIFNIKIRAISNGKSMYWLGRRYSIWGCSPEVSVLCFCRVLRRGNGDGAQIKDGGQTGRTARMGDGR